MRATIGAGLYSLMDTLPNTDVLLGSIVSLGAAANQQRDIILVQQHLKPKFYIPGHITDVAQKGSGIYHMMSWRETALNMGFPQSDWPEFRLLAGPDRLLRSAGVDAWRPALVQPRQGGARRAVLQLACSQPGTRTAMATAAAPRPAASRVDYQDCISTTRWLLIELDASVDVAPGLDACAWAVLNDLQRLTQERSDFVLRHADARLGWIGRFDGQCNIDGAAFGFA